jgi:hypothetical protein
MLNNVPANSEGGVGGARGDDVSRAGGFGLHVEPWPLGRARQNFGYGTLLGASNATVTSSKEPVTSTPGGLAAVPSALMGLGSRDPLGLQGPGLGNLGSQAQHTTPDGRSAPVVPFRPGGGWALETHWVSRARALGTSVPRPNIPGPLRGSRCFGHPLPHKADTGVPPPLMGCRHQWCPHP